MAISDYLMSRLAAAQNARQLALELERAKQQREAAGQRATTQYLQQLLDTGGRLVTTVPGQLAAAEAERVAKLEEEALLEARARGAELAGEETAIPPVSPAAGTALKTLMPEPTVQATVADTKKYQVTPEEYEMALEDMGLEPSPKELTPEQKAKIRSTGAAGVDMSKLGIETKPATIPAMGPEAQKVFGGPAVPAISPEELDKQLREKPVEIKMERPAEAEPMRDTTVPVAADTVMTPEQLKMDSGIDLDKPEVAAAVDALPAVTGYKPLKFKRSSTDLAKEIVDEVEKKLPPENPLTSFLRFGKESGDMARARRMAQLKAKLMIDETRTNAEAKNKNAYLATLNEEKLQKQIKYIEAQSARAVSQATKSQLYVEQKSALPAAQKDVLQAGEQANVDLGRVVKLGKKLISKKQGLPIGAIRALAAAGVTAMGADISAPTSTAIGVGGLGAGVNVSTSGGGKYIDSEKFNEAMKQVDLASLTPEQREFIGKLRLAVQTAGKEREGGRMTDADLRFYLENLIAVDNPQTALRNINDLVEDNARRYGKNYRSLKETATSGLGAFDPDLQYDLFTDEEIDAAFESAPTAMKALPRPEKTSDVTRELATKGIVELQKLLANPNLTAAQKAAVEKEIEAQKTKSPTGGVQGWRK